jgi:hypothetical protein
MSENTPIIPDDRLIDAADAIFRARDELGTDLLPALPADLLGAPDQPEAFCDFTREEITQATMFLARLGLLRCVPPAAG